MNPIEHDYIIVGGGSAGCVLAHRLSADPTVRVLLLEAGMRDINPLISIPLGMGKLHAHRFHDWGYETEPEQNLGSRRLEAMRGKVLGGCSSVNVMAYTRGHPNDYNRWARGGATGWSYDDVLPYFRRSETWEGGENRWRGGSGPVGTQLAKTKDAIFNAWIEAGRQSGYPVTEDYNSEQAEGFGRGQYTIRHGRRSSASRAYLRPVMHRPNLNVETKALVVGLTFEGNRVTGVEYLRNARLVKAKTAREVILSAGTFNSPQILMLSGIGPADHLKSIGITPRVDIPNVGENLQDHLATWITWQRKSPGDFHREMRLDRMTLSMLRAYFLGSGPGTVVPGGLHAFVKTKPELDVPDIEFMFHTVPPQTRLWLPWLRPPYQDAYAIRPTLLHPQSRGRIRLRSTDPRDPPRIEFNFFSSNDDLVRLREGFRRAREVGQQSAMSSYRAIEVSPGPKVATDAEIDNFIRRTALTAHHPAGTCRMGSDPDAVLDPWLRVQGVDNLRVIDASVMPDLVSAHINASVLMIAEKGADIIQKNH